MTTSTLSPVRKSADPAEVRKFALENGFEVGSRGRFSKALVDAFNKGRKGTNRYVVGAFEKTAVAEVKVKVNGKTRTKRVDVKAARALLESNGDVVGARGRLKKSDLVHAVELLG